MNYKRVYDELIYRALKRKTIDGYKERHHILPKSMGGNNSKSNLVELTAREHFIAHMCLALIHGGSQWYAVIVMKSGSRQHYSSRLYEVARIKYANVVSIKRKGIQRPDVSLRLKGVPHSEERRAAQSLRRKGVPQPGVSAAKKGVPNPKLSAAKKGKPLHPNTLAAALAANKNTPNPKVSAAKKGISLSSEHRANVSAAMKGIPKSNEHRTNLSIAKKNKPWSPTQRAVYEKSKFDRECKKLNVLIDSVFQ